MSKTDKININKSMEIILGRRRSGKTTKIFELVDDNSIVVVFSFGVAEVYKKDLKYLNKNPKLVIGNSSKYLLHNLIGNELATEILIDQADIILKDLAQKIPIKAITLNHPVTILEDRGYTQSDKYFDLIYKNSAEEKLKELIKVAAENFSYIICCWNLIDEIVSLTEKMGLDIPYPISFGEFADREYHADGIRSFCIIDADLLLQQIYFPYKIKAMTLNL